MLPGVGLSLTWLQPVRPVLPLDILVFGTTRENLLPIGIYFQELAGSFVRNEGVKFFIHESYLLQGTFP